MTGDFPPRVDHKNRCGSDNRWSNLRLATGSQNSANASPHRGKALPKGVSRNAGKFRARIRVDGELKWLGNFSDAASAHEAYRVAAISFFGEYANGGDLYG